MKAIRKIVSGGQTGADRAAFDFALENGVEIGGFVPKNRLAEDGRISDEYENLTETETENSAERTGLNVVNSDATLVLSRGALKGGTLLTKQLAEEYGKPFLRVDFLEMRAGQSVEKARKWLDSVDCAVLNVAGPRASEDAEIYGIVKQFLKELFRAATRKDSARE